MERYDVAVIGAGPAGSMAAKKAASAGAEVVIFEEHPRAGWPVQCAGLLGVRAVEESELPPGSFLIRPLRGAKVLSPGGLQSAFKAPETKAWVVDRRLFDRALLAEAARAGAEVMMASPVTDLVRGGGRSVLAVGRGPDRRKIEAKVVISAEGAGARIARRAGIGPPRVLLSSAQVELPIEVGDPEMVEIFLGQEVAPGFFGWAIPAQEGAARVGLCCREMGCFHLRGLLKSPQIRSRIRGGPLHLAFGGLPLGPPASTVADGFIAVGDAAGQVKPTSGGGIYPGLVSAKIAGEVAAAAACEGDSSAAMLSEYERRWRAALGREIRLGMIVHRLRAVMADSEMDDLIRHLRDEEDLTRIIEEVGDVDLPSRAIKKVAPRMGFAGIGMAKILLRHREIFK
ncbi:NAD(P)/FAD-dependent oxidoreductase [Methanotrichaceae archaeon M04Ac]|jgi:geranylgeranyl reductase family protein|uniref:NAD(P)/FAD-dependent oxidoreductase n=1 Tax=Candidatus Methanocrinis alkalitolerans TaxID=3033395 RepID=A0ABT5XE38_9EURY|nr:NAD(P)/FAD-dependent oxidoreductase [Candidatus Methanocrinis alkalitolerans]MDF0592973.1 NAD(P)/FAD-dependent oxidoreductase [Candidatus Methanocrinis alkalitolerans]